MSILLSGFEAFGGDQRNPSAEAVNALAGSQIAGHTVHALVLPVTFGLAAQRLLDRLRRLRPTLVIATGLAAGRAELSIERFALNFIDARLPDHAGVQPRACPVVPAAPLALASGLPVDAIVAQLRAAGIPAAPSLSAGAYVCNELFYRLCSARQRAIALTRTSTRTRARPPWQGGFIHLPYASEQLGSRAGIPSLPLATMIEGLRLAAETAIAYASTEHTHGH